MLIFDINFWWHIDLLNKVIVSPTSFYIKFDMTVSYE